MIIWHVQRFSSCKSQSSKKNEKQVCLPKVQRTYKTINLFWGKIWLCKFSAQRIQCSLCATREISLWTRRLLPNIPKDTSIIIKLRERREISESLLSKQDSVQTTDHKSMPCTCWNFTDLNKFKVNNERRIFASRGP